MGKLNIKVSKDKLIAAIKAKKAAVEAKNKEIEAKNVALFAKYKETVKANLAEFSKKLTAAKSYDDISSYGNYSRNPLIPSFNGEGFIQKTDEYDNALKQLALTDETEIVLNEKTNTSFLNLI